jgi:PBSX family phage terminase large subunit
LNPRPLNEKSREVIAHKGFLTVLEGSVRSAKTVTSLVKWYKDILESPDNVFLMSGNTLGSISRNCINGDYGFIAITGGKAKPKTDTDGSKYLELAGKRIYYCGADNKRSFAKIRGLTIGGWYADEIQLHDWDFIETAEARSFASKNRFNIWTLNPDAPGARIYKERIDLYREQQTPGFAWYHFTLDDNTALDAEQKDAIKSQYPFGSVFYRRYVLGQRVRAEGICYPSFKHNKPGEDGNILDVIPKILFAEIGSDIGGNKSATTNALTGYFIDTRGKLCAVLLDESYDTENKSTESILNNWRQFVVKSKKTYQVNDAYPDSAEQLIVKSMRNMGIVNVYGSRKFPILDRIRFLDGAFSNRRVFIMRSCEHTIEAIEAAVWNQKSEKEERLDDGTCNIDSLDAWEYSWERRMTELSD